MGSESLATVNQASVLYPLLTNEHVITALLSPDKAKRDTVGNAFENRIAEYSEEELTDLVGEMLVGLTQDDAFWDQDRRDVLLEALPRVLTVREAQHYGTAGVISDVETRQQLLGLYLTAPEALVDNQDPLGAPLSYLEAGSIIASFLQPGSTDERESIKISLRDLSDAIVAEQPAQYKADFVQAASKIITKLPPPPAAILAAEYETEKRWWRDKPPLSEAQAKLHDLYLQTTKEQRTFKFALAKNTPEFQILASQNGIELAKFWNLNDPEKVKQASSEFLTLADPSTLALMNRALVTRIGMDYTNLTDVEIGLAADQVVEAAAEVAELLSFQPQLFADQIAKFSLLLEKAATLPGPKAHAVVKPIVKFFKTYGINDDLDLKQITQLLADPQALASIEENFNARYQRRRETANQLIKLFGTCNVPDQFSLIARNRNDLFLGDLTRDCTAYHLDVGTNAWTVPVWLSNPGFTIFKISEGDRLLAKAGLLLGLSTENNVTKPVLIIDSVEYVASVVNFDLAAQAIREGLAYIRDWAAKVGIDEIRIFTYANSQQLRKLLEQCQTESTADYLEALGGLEGVKELDDNLTGNQNTVDDYEIYLQTAYDEEEDAIPANYQAATEQMRVLEVLVSSLTEDVKDEIHRRELSDLLRNGSWKQFFEKYLVLEAPNVVNAIGKKWETYLPLMYELIYRKGEGYTGSEDLDRPILQRLYDWQYEVERQTVLEAIGDDGETVWRDEALRSIASDHVAYEKSLVSLGVEPIEWSDETEESAPDENPYIRMRNEATDVEDLLESIHDLITVGIQPDDALKFLYGAAAVSNNQSYRPGSLALRRTTPLLSI